MDEPRPELGAKLRRLRTERRLTIVAAAKAIGISKAHMWNLENREVNPSRELLLRLASVYGVRTVDLVDLGVETPVEEARLSVLFRDMKELSTRDLDTIETLVKQMKSR